MYCFETTYIETHTLTLEHTKTSRSFTPIITEDIVNDANGVTRTILCAYARKGKYANAAVTAQTRATTVRTRAKTVRAEEHLLLLVMERFHLWTNTQQQQQSM
jgi:hypothetical protein